MDRCCCAGCHCHWRPGEVEGELTMKRLPSLATADCFQSFLASRAVEGRADLPLLLEGGQKKRVVPAPPPPCAATAHRSARGANKVTAKYQSPRQRNTCAYINWQQPFLVQLSWLVGATVARLTPDQKVARSNRARVKHFAFLLLVLQRAFSLSRERAGRAVEGPTRLRTSSGWRPLLDGSP